MATTGPERPAETLVLPGPAGGLEAVLTVPPEALRRAAVVAHPHPLYGGSMHNAVVVETAHRLGAWGAATLRFNFRGVGASAGRYDRGVGEVDDLQTALAEMQRRYPAFPLVLAGYSFGARVALEVARRRSPPRAAAVLALAPPLALDDFSFVAGLHLPLALVCGELDELTPAEDLEAASQRWSSLVALERVPGAGHDLGAGSGALRRALDAALEALAPGVLRTIPSASQMDNGAV